ncbi:TlpA family protein disulfide reductase [Saccharicrinis sp. GN24d3]
MKTILLLGLLSGVLGSECLAQDVASLVKAGDLMPAFNLKSADENISSSDLKGKVVLINFFATWCPPCIKELPYVKKEIADKYKNRKDFKLLVVGREHTQAEMDKFKAEKFDLPFYPDKDRAMYGKFAMNTIPRNYVIDKSGKIIYASTGFSIEEFEKMLDLLKRELQNSNK